MAERIGYRIADEEYAIGLLSSMYKTPIDAFKEYPSNSIDGRVKGETEKILILISKEEGRISVIDTGVGMSYEELKRIPQNICLSKSRGLTGKIGKHEVGMLSFFQFGEMCTVVSKKYGEEGPYNFLRMVKKESPLLDILNQEDVKALGCQPLVHGTNVNISGIPKDLISIHFMPSKLVKFLGDQYSPVLRSGEVEITVGYFGKYQKQIFCEPLKHKGDCVLEDTVEIEYKKEGESKAGKIDILLYLNKEGTDERIGHYNEGSKVAKLVDIPQFNKAPWNTGKLSGEINENFVPLNAPKSAVIEGTKRLKIFYEALGKYEPDLSRMIERISIKKKHELEKFAEEVLRKINEAYRNFAFRLPALTLGKKGDLEMKVKEIPGIVVTRLGGKRKPDKESGREVVRPGEEGEIKPVRGGRRILTSYEKFSFDDFDIEEKDKRSKMGLGGLIRINTSHLDYVELSKKGKQSDKEQYVSIVIATEIANNELQEAIKARKITEDEAKEWGKDLAQQFLWYTRV